MSTKGDDVDDGLQVTIGRATGKSLSFTQKQQGLIRRRFAYQKRRSGNRQTIPMVRDQSGKAAPYLECKDCWRTTALLSTIKKAKE